MDFWYSIKDHPQLSEGFGNTPFSNHKVVWGWVFFILFLQKIMEMAEVVTTDWRQGIHENQLSPIKPDIKGFTKMWMTQFPLSFLLWKIIFSIINLLILWFDIRVIFVPQETFGHGRRHSLLSQCGVGRGCYQHPVRRSQACCWMSRKAQGNWPQQRFI